MAGFAYQVHTAAAYFRGDITLEGEAIRQLTHPSLRVLITPPSYSFLDRLQ